MSVASFRNLCNKFRFYNFSTIEDFENWIDYNWDKIDVNKYKEHWLIKNNSWLPTDYQGYGLK